MDRRFKRIAVAAIGAVLILTAGNSGAVSARSKHAAEKYTKHFVAFKFKETTTEDQKKSVREAFLGLKKKIPFIIAIKSGPNTSPENLSKGMTDGFLLTFKTAKDRDRYLTHPAHVQFKKMALPLVADVFIFDFEARPDS